MKKTRNHNDRGSQTGGFEGFGRFGDLRLISRRFRRLTILVAISRWNGCYVPLLCFEVRVQRLKTWVLAEVEGRWAPRRLSHRSLMTARGVQTAVRTLRVRCRVDQPNRGCRNVVCSRGSPWGIVVGASRADEVGILFVRSRRIGYGATPANEDHAKNQ